jgi:ABC-type polysaccharide transport system, permease component
MYGVLIAFKDYRIMDGIFSSQWVGLKYFNKALEDPYFITVLKNTVIISIYKFVCCFPAPIIFALLLNELIFPKFKKVVQTVSYLPFFLSWVILGGIFINILSLEGPVNTVLSVFGVKPTILLAEPKLFRSILVITDIWKGFGWNSVIYIASLSNIDVKMYEAAIIDGASRLKRIIFITIPSLGPVIVISLILSCSNILNIHFDQVYNLYNPMVMNVADIIDTYVYRRGLIDMDYSYTTAVGIFKSLVSMMLMITTNSIANRYGGKGYGLW